MRSLFVYFALLVASASIQAERPGNVLVHYDFDTDAVETGPYTLMVFENSRGTVELTEAYRHSGYRSVEIRDVAGDGDFAELQGYFLERSSGVLFIRFALMTASPCERFNVAFAGPDHFVMRKGGIGIWLKNKEGVLHQVSAHKDQALFETRAFTWYQFELTYDIDRGTYDLTVSEEGSDEPVVELTDQPNAVGEPGSSLIKFSFIGDVPWMDGSNAHFYVDDLEIRTDSAVRQGPFVAPGRRMLFVDLWDYYRKQMYERPGCPPVLDHADFGLGPRDLQALSRVDALEPLEALLDGREITSVPEQLDPYQQTLFAGLADWQRGCRSDNGCDASCAAELFERAAATIPDAKLPKMCRVLALAGAKRWAEADELFLTIYPDWQTDPRLPAISAVLGLAREDLEGAESALLTVPEELADIEPSPLLQRLWSGRLDRQLAEDLKATFGGSWVAYVEAALVAEHRYYVLLWQDRHDEARRYAERMMRRYLAFGLAADKWLERTADAAFHAGDHQAALARYELALQEAENPTPILLKLSDVYFKLGDVEMERAYRQRIYGTLEPKWTTRDPVPNLDVDPCQCPQEGDG